MVNHPAAHSIRNIAPIITAEIIMPVNKSPTALPLTTNPRLFIERRSKKRRAMNTEIVIANPEKICATIEGSLSGIRAITVIMLNKISNTKKSALCPKSRHPARKRLSPGDMNMREKIERVEEASIAIPLP